MKELENLGIKSPTGKDKWNKRTVELTLIKRKYIGEAELLKSDENSTYYLVSDNNPAIISKEVFEAVQKRKPQRSNVTVDENGNDIVAQTNTVPRKNNQIILMIFVQ